MESFPLSSHGARLHARLAPPRGRPLLVFCHGFPGRNWNDRVAAEVTARGFGALLFRYRGAHGSEGAYAFRHNEEDIVAAIEAARPHAPHGLGLLGYSMGGFHATRALAREPTLADFVVLQAPLADVHLMRKRIGAPMWDAFLAEGANVLAAPHAQLVEEARAHRPEDDPVHLAPMLKMPALVVHGSADVEVPPEQGRALFEAWGGAKEHVEIAGADHHFAGHEADVARAIDRFVAVLG